MRNTATPTATSSQALRRPVARGSATAFSSSATFFAFAFQAASNTSPTSGTDPTAASVPMFSSIRPMTALGTPSRTAVVRT